MTVTSGMFRPWAASCTSGPITAPARLTAAAAQAPRPDLQTAVISAAAA